MCRYVVDRIYAEHQAMDDLELPEAEDARMAAAVRGGAVQVECSCPVAPEIARPGFKPLNLQYQVKNQVVLKFEFKFYLYHYFAG